jgi:hypothetical protein
VQHKHWGNAKNPPGKLKPTDSGRRRGVTERGIPHWCVAVFPAAKATTAAEVVVARFLHGRGRESKVRRSSG